MTTDPTGRLTIPSYLRASCENEGPERRAWLEQLPATVADLAERWVLELEEPYEPGGSCAWVAPGTDAAGREVVLKVSWTHTEALHEAEGLAAFGGSGAVEVYAFEHAGATTSMLLERCRPGAELRTRPEDEQHVVITGLLRRTWAAELADGHPFRPLTQMCDQWADEADEHLAAGRPDLDPGLVRDGLTLFRELPRSASSEVLLCTDLHAGNVLSDTCRSAEPTWLLIDPKPYVGDPHYDVLQHLLNCEVSLRERPLDLLTRVAALAELDPERVRRWLFARCVQETVSAPPPWREYDDRLLRRLAGAAAG